MKNYSIRYLKWENKLIPSGLNLTKDIQLFDHFIAQIHTKDYYKEIFEKVQEVLTGKISQYIFEHNDVYLTLQKDLTSIRVEYIQDQYPEDKAPKEEYYAEMDTKEFLEVLQFWWVNYSEYLSRRA